MHRQFPGHGYFRDLSSSAHTEVEKLAPPLRLTPHCDLRRFHQQIAQQGVPLLADMSEPPPVAAGFLRRNQPHIAGDLLAAVKPFWSSNYQLERQCRQRANSRMGHELACHPTLLYLSFHGSRQFLDLWREFVE